MAHPQTFIAKKAVAAAAIESTIGTAETLADADFDTRIRDVEFTGEIASYLLEYNGGGHNVSGAVMGAAEGGLSYSIDIRPGSAAGVAPRWMKHAMFCGFRQEARILFSTVVITGNKFNCNVNGVAISEVTFATDANTTFDAILAAIVVALPGAVATKIFDSETSTMTLFVTHPTDLVSISGAVVTAGVSQATVTLSTAISEDDTTDDVTATLGYYMKTSSGDAVKALLKGAHAGHDFGFDSTGNPVVFKVVGMKASLVSMTDADALVITGVDTTDVPGTIGITLTDGSVDQYVDSMQIQGNHEISLRKAGQDATGTHAGYCSARGPRLNWNPYIDFVATDAAWTKWRAGTKTAVAYVGPTVAGQKLRISIPKIQMLEMNPTNRDGSFAWEQASLIVKDPGVPAYTISFGA